MCNVHNINSLALAYLGDSIYELYIREYLISQGLVKVNDLQNAAIKYVSAKSQAKYLNKMIEMSFLTDEEQKITIRARNHKTTSHPKNTDIITYKYSTGLEALIGYLYLEGKKDRVAEIMSFIVSHKLN